MYADVDEVSTVKTNFTYIHLILLLPVLVIYIIHNEQDNMKFQTKQENFQEN